MEVVTRSGAIADSDADVTVVFAVDGVTLPEPAASAHGAADARSESGEMTLLRPSAAERVLVAGIGDLAEAGADDLRELGAKVAKELKRLRLASVAVEPPSRATVDDGDAAAALVEGLILGSYSFDRYKSAPDDEPAPVRLSSIEVYAADEDVAERVETARIVAEAANRARDLQATGANHMTPSALAERAAEIADRHDSIEIDVLDRTRIEGQGMGGLAAVAQGSDEEPRLITMRYRGRGSGDVLGLVGKAVTFDSGGISIKPALGMQEMKMDMSGGAAVLEAIDAIATLGLEIDTACVVAATENMVSGHAMRPGDVITHLSGKTTEVTNTDAEGRLILADALTWCIRDMGADRVVDIATLTGAVVIALGSTYAALISNDEEFAAMAETASEATGELLWRMPLHRDYRTMIDGTVSDLVNTAAKREAGTNYAGAYLREFVDDTPWVHIDIAGTAWDSERAYAGKGPTGFGVRLLVAIAAARAAVLG